MCCFVSLLFLFAIFRTRTCLPTVRQTVASVEWRIEWAVCLLWIYCVWFVVWRYSVMCIVICLWNGCECLGFIGRDSPQWTKVSSFTTFIDHTQWRTTVGRALLDEWSARRRDLYLTTHDTHNRQTSMPPVGFEPTISAGERPQTYALDHAATGTGKHSYMVYINIIFKSNITYMVSVRTLNLMSDKRHRSWYLGVSSQTSPVPMTALTG